MSDQGGKRVSQIDSEFRAWALSQPTTGGCLFCPDFRPQGTGNEVAAANADHLESVHPELVGKKRRKRRSSPAVISFRQALTEEESSALEEERRRRLFQLGIEPAQKIA